MKLKYSFLILLILILLSVFSCKTKNENTSNPPKVNKIANLQELIMSSIGDQEVIVGSHLFSFFVLPNPSNETITFDTTSLPAKLTHKLVQKGVSILDFSPEDDLQKAKNQSVIKINATTDLASNSIKFSIKSKAPSGKRYHISEDYISEIEHIFGLIKANKEPATLFFDTGNYGHLTIKGMENVTIVPAIGQEPIFDKISVLNSKNCNFSSLVITKENDKGKADYYVYVDSLSKNINLSNCLIQAATNTHEWQASDWKNKAANGIYSLGDHCQYSHNLIQNIHHGLETKGNHNTINNNIIIQFAGDAIRNTGDDNIFDSNYMADAVVDDYYAKDGNHDDLFQCWTFDKPILNLVITNNIAINTTDTSRALQSKNVQGIACFDGFEENWVIENNLVILEHPHGIALFGANQCKIQNNRIIPNPFNSYQFESQPWIMVANHKDGRPSHNNLINNNLVSVLKITDATANIEKNQIIDSIPAITFPKYKHWIFTQKR